MYASKRIVYYIILEKMRPDSKNGSDAIFTLIELSTKSLRYHTNLEARRMLHQN